MKKSKKNASNQLQIKYKQNNNKRTEGKNMPMYRAVG